LDRSSFASWKKRRGSAAENVEPPEQPVPGTPLPARADEAKAKTAETVIENTPARVLPTAGYAVVNGIPMTSSAVSVKPSRKVTEKPCLSSTKKRSIGNKVKGYLDGLSITSSESSFNKLGIALGIIVILVSILAIGAALLLTMNGDLGNSLPRASMTLVHENYAATP
jgi:hypothetical protein